MEKIDIPGIYFSCTAGGLTSAFSHDFSRKNLAEDVFDREEEKSHALLLTTASSCQQFGNADPIDFFYARSEKKKNQNKTKLKKTKKKQPPETIVFM